MRLALLFGAILLAGPADVLAQTAPLSWTLTGEEAPQVQPWTQPASLSYVDSSDDGEDRTQLNLALKVAGQFDGSANTWFLRGVAQVSDRAQEEQEAYSVQLGVHLEPRTVALQDGLPDPDQLSLFTDIALGYNSKAVFGSPATAACVANPALPTCDTQHERSVRLSVDLQPHLAVWEQAYGLATVNGQTRTSDDWAWSFAPRAVVFHDEVTDAVVDAAGRRAEGGVTGVKWSAALAVSPPIFDHRLLFRASWQQITAFDVASARELTFDDDTRLVTASLDWELGVRAFDDGGKPKGWAPSIGVTWSDGDDALTGRIDKDDVTVAFRLTYRGG